MRASRRNRSNARGASLLVIVGCLCVTGYFTHHAAYGTHGTQAQSRLLARQLAIQHELTRHATLRERLTRDVAALATDPPSRDITDEIARDVLGMARPGEHILPGR